MDIEQQEGEANSPLDRAGRWREHVVEYRSGREEAELDRKLRPELFRLHGGKAESVFRSLKLYLRTPTIIDDFDSHDDRRDYRTSLHFETGVDPNVLKEEEEFRKNNRLRQNFLLFIWATLESAHGLTNVSVNVDLEELKARIKHWCDTNLEDKLSLIEELDVICFDIFEQMSQ